jgi:(E)-4-hydroxy-3-methyl-but-2-enyl pyrophosphate reductase
MKIVVAKTAGFCMGVRRAVDMVLDASNIAKGRHLYTYGPLIHNPQVLNMLEEKKISKLDQIPEKGSGVVLIRAHGVPPEEKNALKDAGFNVIDATCPRVVKVQQIINKYARKGYSTIVLGDAKHPEVVGLLGYAEDLGHTVKTLEQLEKLPRFDNAVVVAQTTQNTALYDSIKSWCKIHTPKYKIFDTICGSTQKRQMEIRKLANENDAVIVVGGKQSGNTKRLAQIASETGKPAVHTEDGSHIDYDKLSSAGSIAITAGASTPNWIINDTCARIAANLQKQSPGKAFLFVLRDFLLKTNILAASGAGFLTYTCSVMQGFDRDLRHPLIAMLYVFSMQILNNLFMIKSDKYNNPKRALFYKHNKKMLWFIASLSGITGLYLSLSTGIISFVVLLVMSFLGLSYNLKFIPVMTGKGKIARIKDIPGSKTILITIAWGIVTSLLPAVANQSHLFPVTIVFCFSAGLVFARTAFFDILAIQGDRITGRETLPILMGEKQSFNIIQFVLIFNICIVLLAILLDILANRTFILIFIPFMMLLLIRFFRNDTHITDVYREFIVESLFFGAGVISIVIQFI